MNAAATCFGNFDATTPTTQFTFHNDDTVTDTKTGLMWKQCPEGLTGAGCAIGTATQFTWQNALTQAQTINTSGFAGHNDWRVPNIKELRSITEKQCYSPSINSTVFPNTSGGAVFWSSSPNATNVNDAWLVYFVGSYVNQEPKSNLNQVRLVRGG
jgi:hypothetical protein